MQALRLPLHRLIPVDSPLLLRAESLTLNRGDRVVIADLSLALSAGTALHVIGRNGAGKTTLLETLAGLRRPQSGQLSLPPGGLQWLSARNALHASLSAVENLEYWCALQAVPTRGIVAALERLGVQRQRHRPLRTLSTGQKRRVALARLLLAPRPLWLLDEPLSGLDVDGVALCFALIEEQLAAGGAVVLTSHQPLQIDPASLRVLELA